MIRKVVFMKPRYLLVAFLVAVPAVYAQSFGGRCPVKADSSVFAQLSRRYVPTGANGRLPAVGIYRVGSNGQRLESIYEQNVHNPQAVASTQKLLTAYTAYKLNNLNRNVTFNEDDLRFDSLGTAARHPTQNRAMRVGDSVRIGQLIRTLMYESSNGAALAIARGSAGGDVGRFMQEMNRQKDLLLGGRNNQSHFLNPAGLGIYNESYRFMPDAKAQQSTVSEMAVMTSAMMADRGFVRAMRTYGLSELNRGQVVKGGYTRESGRTLIARLPLPNKCRGEGIVLVLFGDNNDGTPPDTHGFMEQVNREIHDAI
jgi:D-alanyl-D-alanine carboxypeptidase